MKKIVVFGGLGFIGGHVVDNLVKKGYKVMVFTRHELNTSPEMLPDEKYDVFYGDIKDREAVLKAVLLNDGAINLAGILGTSETIDNPFPSVEVNILGGLNFLQAVREAKIPAVQIAVGNYFMNNSYAITKTTTERLALMYNKEHGTKIAVVRGLNAYGPRQKHAPVRKIAPNFIVSALQGKSIKINGNGEQIMDMIYVKDLAEIIVRALITPHGVYDRPFEAGTGMELTVNEIANAVVKYVQKKWHPYPEGAEWIEHVPMRAGEPENAIVLADPMTLLPLGQEDLVMWGINMGMEATIEWYKKFYPWKDAK